jgi:hypothetical protein
VALSFKPIKPLLQTGTNTVSRWLSYIGLGIGVMLLLASIQMFVNIQQLVGGNVIHKNGYDFISITKKITNESMGISDKNVFHADEIEELKRQPFIQGVAPLVANEFHVQLSVAGILRTDLFLETLDNEFIDTVPPSFKWEEGQTMLPIIIGSDFFEAYNVFAPGQSLPQISTTSAMTIPIAVTCSGKGRVQNYTGYIVAFSDRVNSVLVPKEFLEYSNETLGEIKQGGSSRVFLKTKDANDPDLLNFLERKNYNVNKEKTKFGREKRIMQGILSGLGVFGMLVVIMALMLFSFYLQLVIARSRDNLQLLLLLGYSPGWLGRNVSKQFVPVYILVVFTALVATQILQWAFHHYVMYDRPELNTIVSWIVIAIAVALTILSIVTNYRLVKKLLYRLY